MIASFGNSVMVVQAVSAVCVSRYQGACSVAHIFNMCAAITLGDKSNVDRWVIRTIGIKHAVMHGCFLLFHDNVYDHHCCGHVCLSALHQLSSALRLYAWTALLGHSSNG